MVNTSERTLLGRQAATSTNSMAAHALSDYGRSSVFPTWVLECLVFSTQMQSGGFQSHLISLDASLQYGLLSWVSCLSFYLFLSYTCSYFIRRAERAQIFRAIV